MADDNVPQLALIAALGRNNVIGRDNQLLWHLPADMAFFKATTSGHVVVMGRKTYDSLPDRFRPLPNRTNIVVSRQAASLTDIPDRLFHVSDLDAALKRAADIAEENQQAEYFVIGGGELYTQCLPRAKRLYLTHVDTAPEGDAFFPVVDLTDSCRQNVLEEHAATETQPAFRIVRYERV